MRTFDLFLSSHLFALYRGGILLFSYILFFFLFCIFAFFHILDFILSSHCTMVSSTYSLYYWVHSKATCYKNVSVIHTMRNWEYMYYLKKSLYNLQNVVYDICLSVNNVLYIRLCAK